MLASGMLEPSTTVEIRDGRDVDRVVFSLRNVLFFLVRWREPSISTVIEQEVKSSSISTDDQYQGWISTDDWIGGPPSPFHFYPTFIGNLSKQFWTKHLSPIRSGEMPSMCRHNFSDVLVKHARRASSFSFHGMPWCRDEYLETAPTAKFVLLACTLFKNTSKDDVALA